MVKKVKTVQVDGKEVIYTHKFIPNDTNIKLTWKQMFYLLLQRKIVVKLNVYLNNDKIVYIVGNIE